MLTKERAVEMQGKLADLGGYNRLKRPMMVDGEQVGEVREMRLDFKPTTALVGLGVAKDEVEAREFLVFLTESALAAALTGITDPMTAATSLVQLGFYLGVQTGKAKLEKAN